MDQSFAILTQHRELHRHVMPVQEMRRLGTHLELELPQCVITIGKKGDLLVHLEVLRSQYFVETAFRLGIQGLHKPKALERGCLVLFFTLVKTPDTLADNDFELTLLVHPIAHIALVNTHFKADLPLKKALEFPILSNISTS